MLKRKTKTRLHIRSIKDAARGNTAPALDKEIAELFREMRQATGLSEQEIANRLKTSTQTIDLLERGELSSLPGWNEINRVVVEYANMLGLDPEPVLRRVMLQLPGDHPRRPRTQEIEPSFDNMRANAKAIMNRVPESESAVENTSLSTQHQYNPPPPSQRATGGGAETSPEKSGSAQSDFSPGYGDMRAPPRGSVPYSGKSPAHMVAKKRKTSVFVPLVQLLLLLIILGTGYMMWLGVNDPQGYEDIRSVAVTGWETLAQRFEELRTP